MTFGWRGAVAGENSLHFSVTINPQTNAYFLSLLGSLIPTRSTALNLFFSPLLQISTLHLPLTKKARSSLGLLPAFSLSYPLPSIKNKMQFPAAHREPLLSSHSRSSGGSSLSPLPPSSPRPPPPDPRLIPPLLSRYSAEIDGVEGEIEGVERVLARRAAGEDGESERSARERRERMQVRSWMFALFFPSFKFCGFLW